MDEKIKFSIIIPVYNVGLYIDECISSIIRQTYNNWEIILINDGSIDNSGEICKKHESNKIKYYYQENHGVSVARNEGINKCTGEYILFLDGDDMLADNALETIASYTPHIDLIVYRWATLYPNGLRGCSPMIIPSGYKSEYIDKQTTFEKLIYTNDLGSACLIATKAKLIKENALRFSQNITYLEDQMFCFQAFEKAQTAVFLNSCLYYYRIRRSSAVRRFSIKKIEDINLFLNFIIKKAVILDDKINENRIAQRFFDFLLAELVSLIKTKHNLLKQNVLLVINSEAAAYAVNNGKYAEIFKRRIAVNIRKRSVNGVIRQIKLREFAAKLAGKRRNDKILFD